MLWVARASIRPQRFPFLCDLESMTRDDKGEFVGVEGIWVQIRVDRMPG